MYDNSVLNKAIIKIQQLMEMKTTNPKQKWLPKSLRNYANYLKQDFQNNTEKRYPYLKRGTIVMVDFGVNIGSEFSGTHFAIVLDKKDNNKKHLITVIPLTSKLGKDKVFIGKELFNKAVEFTDNKKLNWKKNLKH